MEHRKIRKHWWKLPLATQLGITWKCKMINWPLGLDQLSGISTNYGLDFCMEVPTGEVYREQASEFTTTEMTPERIATHCHIFFAWIEFCFTLCKNEEMQCRTQTVGQEHNLSFHSGKQRNRSWRSMRIDTYTLLGWIPQNFWFLQYSHSKECISYGIYIYVSRWYMYI